MSSVVIKGNASGTGSVTIESPNTNSDYTVTLPQATTALVGTDATQTLTNKTWASPASSTISSATSQASTSGTSIDFTGIPSWVKRITVLFDGVSTNGTSGLLIQIGSGSVTTSGYTSTAGNTGTGNGDSTAGFLLTISTAATDILSGHVLISSIGSNVYIESGMLAVSGGRFQGSGGKSGALGDTLDRVRITTVNGTDTFDAGSINILFE